jgi:hypothetical protein
MAINRTRADPAAGIRGARRDPVQPRQSMECFMLDGAAVAAEET